MNKAILGFVCMCAMLALPAGAQDGLISGTVTSLSGQPLTGIVVRSYNPTAGVMGSSATTGANGMYAISVAEGTWRVRFWDPNTVYMPEVYNNVGGQDFSLGADIVVSAGMGVTGMDASLAELASIFGRVTGQMGQPLQGITVAIAYNEGWTSHEQVLTDSNGLYTVGGLYPKTYRMAFFEGSGANFIPEVYNGITYWGADPDYHSGAASNIVLSAGDHISINASLATWSTISGTVRGTDGTTPLAGIVVTAFKTSNWSVASSSTSASNGVYTLDHLFSGTYRVRFADTNGAYAAEVYDDIQFFDPQYGGMDIPIPESLSVSHIDAQLARASSLISGTVTGGGPFNSPLTGIVVETSNVTDRVLGPSALTDSNGNYAVGGLSPRIYHMRFVSTNGFYIGEVYNNVIGDDFSLGADLALSAGEEVSGINASLEKRQALAGVVRQEGEGNFDIQFTGTLDWGYVLQEAATLTGGWIDVDSSVIADAGTSVLSRTTSATQTFWRVRLLPP